MTVPTANGQPSTAIAPRNQIIGLVEKYADNINKLAPRGMSSDYYVEELRLYLSQPDKDGGPSPLLKCEPVSIARGILRVAQTGLSLGVSCDLLPFGKTCQFSARYTGIVELALQSGARSINADAVFDDDPLFEYQKGTEFYIRHRRGPRKGKLTHFYALGELKPSSFVFVVMTRDEVEAHKTRYSKQWKNVRIEDCLWYGMKTAIRQLAKFLPKNPRFASALQFDAQTEEDISDGEYQVMNGKHSDPAEVESAIMDTRPALMEGDERPADGQCSDAQRERLLDLIEHPAILDATRDKIKTKLRTGLAWNIAALWIQELERAIGTPTESDNLLIETLS